MENTLSLDEAFDELSSAEDFLAYFEVPYEPAVVQVNRLHILQRFHDYLTRHVPQMPDDDAAARAVYAGWLARAYQDFVVSDAQTEKVFAVFQHAPNASGGTTSFVSIDKVFQA
ncbi:nitrogenase-stabilizing/protective protein NifW [Denitromonas iodatirespirans]|uniref:Nitrogenase-stabilizing/protective protein NifW n=1 Tax=Denitromonas iodatirespirans TaxID=2795389 RepID=A0A944H6T9_DENI1|nr:nitrogenase-stabilizing/protective protein NifW [Denitromonas iodatirespirans]MBT0960504.1 nitrogenase-stabilizing/protective protein NifW [Denitromonas iodatirespirans]